MKKSNLLKYQQEQSICCKFKCEMFFLHNVGCCIHIYIYMNINNNITIISYKVVQSNIVYDFNSNVK